MTLKPHETLLNGKYLIERVLGRGGFGFVYLARDTIIGRPVAIKEMNPSLADDDQMVRRFLVEGRATLQLRHPNIVEVYDVFSDRGFYYLAMEYCPGGSLDERLAAGPLVVSDALAIMDQVCAGLAHTHSRGIVHCDVKPANILFGSDGLAKVTDFGVAHVSSTAVARSWGTVSSFTAGTLYYMAPEQLDGVRDNPRVDVYALGAMLYRMITGGSYLDFHSEATISDQIHNALLIKQGAPLAPSQRVRDVPGWLDQVILLTLSKDPAARHADAGALRTALHPVAAAAPRVSATPATPPTVVLSTKPRPPAARPASRGTPAWMWVMAGGLGVLILVVVALAVTLSNNPVTDVGPAEGGGTIVPTATLRGIVMATETPARPQPTVIWTPSPTIAQPTKPAGTTAAVQVTPTGASPTVTPKPATVTPKPPTLEPTASPAPSIATSLPPTLTPASLPAPVLLSPADGASVSGETTFTWSWSGPELAADQAFEVRIWKDGQPVHYGATGPVRTTRATFDVAGAYAVIQGGSGDYFWTVAVVVPDPYQATGPEAPPRALRIELSDGGSGGGTVPTPTRPP